MRHEPNLRVDGNRVYPTNGQDQTPGANAGFFQFGEIFVISSGQFNGWEHVSVSCRNRCPSWEEMDKIKKLFWRDDETVAQFHPREDVKKNFHPFCLHLWKQVDSEYLLPADILI
jgi:hypothetical protein